MFEIPDMPLILLVSDIQDTIETQFVNTPRLFNDALKIMSYLNLAWPECPACAQRLT